MTPSPTSSAYLPAGYCRCGYRTDPGTCPECGRTNRRMRRWDPKRRSRWIERAGIAVASLAAISFGGKYVLWNWWPLESAQRFANLRGAGWYPVTMRSWAKSVLDYRARKRFDYANARWSALSKSPPPNHGHLEGVYFDETFGITAYVTGGEFLIANEPHPDRKVSFGRPGVQLLGNLIGISDSTLTIEVPFTALPPPLPPGYIQPYTLEYVRASLDDQPLLVRRDCIQDAWNYFRAKRPSGLGRFTKGRGNYFFHRTPRPSGDPFLNPFRRQRNLLVPPEYCDEIWRSSVYGTVIEVHVMDFEHVAEIVLNIGQADGVRWTTEFPMSPTPNADVLKVTSLEERTCIVVAEPLALSRSNYWPDLGTVLRSISDEE